MFQYGILLSSEVLIFVNNEGLILRDISNEPILLKWEDISYIYHLGRYNILSIIDSQGHAFSGKVLPDSHFSTKSEKISYIWRTWNSGTPNANEMDTFKYHIPESNKGELEIGSLLFGGPFLGGFMVFILIMSIFKVELLPIVLGYFILCLFIAIPALLEGRRPCMDTVHFSNSILTVTYDDGSCKNFKISDIKKHSLNNPRKSKAIIFTDGTKLKNFDRLSYWVVLKDRLICQT